MTFDAPCCGVFKGDCLGIVCLICGVFELESDLLSGVIVAMGVQLL
jgi:hypothetical protein